MKTSILTLASLLFLSSGFSQREVVFTNADDYYPYELHDNLQNEEIRDKISELQIKSETMTITDRKGHQTTIHNTYNREGKLTQYQSNFLAKDKLTTTYKLNYGEKGLAKLQLFDFKGSLAKERFYTRDDEGRILTYFSRKNGQEKFLYKVENTFNGKQLVNREFYTDGDEEKVFKKWVYSYDENGKPSITKYFKKNKLKYTWHYDCKAAGELEKSKDTSTVCTWDELDNNGNPISYKQTTNEKGQVIKAKYVRDKNTNKIISYETWDMNGTPLVSNITNAEKRHYTIYKKGKVSYQAIIELDPKTGNRLKTQNVWKKHPKWNRTSEFIYDENGLPKMEIQYQGGKLYKSISVSREYYK